MRTCEHWSGEFRDGEPTPCGEPAVKILPLAGSGETLATCTAHLNARPLEAQRRRFNPYSVELIDPDAALPDNTEEP